MAGVVVTIMDVKTHFKVPITPGKEILSPIIITTPAILTTTPAIITTTPIAMQIILTTTETTILTPSPGRAVVTIIRAAIRGTMVVGVTLTATRIQITINLLGNRRRTLIVGTTLALINKNLMVYFTLKVNNN